MKILWVKAGGLVPPDTGGKIRSYNILRELARQHSVTFFSFYSAHDGDVHSSLGDVFQQVVCVPLSLPRPKSSAELLDYVARFFSSEPYGIKKYCRPEVRRRLKALCEEQDFDVMVCDFVFAAGAVSWDWPGPKILFTHNVEAMIWRRHYEVAANPLWKALSWWEWRRMEAAERRYLRLADRVLAVSETDRKVFATFLDSKTLSVIPTGVDVEFFHPLSVEEAPNSLAFIGSMDWLPNEDGVLYFVESILPLIKKECPEISLTVVGRNPSRKLQAVASQEKSMHLTGWVADVRPFVAQAAVCIVPLRIGGGTRLKIFEAMAMGKAVISTTVGAEGLPVESGKNILLADTPDDFAQSVIRLLSNSQLRQRLGSGARLLVQENYSWGKVADSFARILQDALSSKNPREASS